MTRHRESTRSLDTGPRSFSRSLCDPPDGWLPESAIRVSAIALSLAACTGNPRSDDLRFPDAGVPYDGSPWDRFDATATGPVRPTDAGPQPPASAIATGDDQLVAFFVDSSGYLVVRRDGVERLDHGGAVRAGWETPYRVTAAAFERSTLAIADEARVATLDPESLSERASSVLARPCSAAAMLAAGRVVCRNVDGEFDLSFSIYDLGGHGELGRSARFPRFYTSRVFAVPGEDAFVGIASEISSTPFVYRVQDGVASLAGRAFESETTSLVPFVTVVAADTPLLVNDRGYLFRFDGCVDRDRDCFERVGSIGTVGLRERVVAMDDLAQDSVVTLSEPTPAGQSFCASGCDVRRTDLATRRVMAEGRFDGPLAEIVAVRVAPDGSGAVVAGHSVCDGIRCWGWSVTPVRWSAR